MSWFEDHLPASVKASYRPLEPDVDEEERRLVQEIADAEAQAREQLRLEAK